LTIKSAQHTNRNFPPPAFRRLREYNFPRRADT